MNKQYLQIFNYVANKNSFKNVKRNNTFVKMIRDLIKINN